MKTPEQKRQRKRNYETRDEDDTEKSRSWERKKRCGGDIIEFKVRDGNIKKVGRVKTSALQRSIDTVIQEQVLQRSSLSITRPSASGFIRMIDTFDRPAYAYIQGPYAEIGAYAHGGENKPGKRIPKAGAYARAGLWKAKTEFSVFEVEANGPNVSAGVEVSPFKVEAKVGVELGSVSVAAGPVGVKLGLGVGAGFSTGVDGMEVNLLGSGVRIGLGTNVSVVRF